MSQTISIEQARKALVPKWIKFFGWLFILMGVVSPVFYLSSFLFGFEASYELYGLSYSGTAYSTAPFIICVLASLSGLAAYGLLFGKNWGLKACLMIGYLGLIVTVFSMFIVPGVNIRLEPLIQIPYLVKLNRIQS